MGGVSVSISCATLGAAYGSYYYVRGKFLLLHVILAVLFPPSAGVPMQRSTAPAP